MTQGNGKIRLGIIGYGGMGTVHAAYLMKGLVPNAVLTAICDTSAARRQAARKDCGEKVQYFDNDEAFFAANIIDAVMVVTPHYSHPALAIAALNRGLHVMVEKPAGVYARQVREMNEVAAASNRVFSIMLMKRSRLGYQRLHELVASGELGSIKRTMYVVTDWLRTQIYYDSGGWRGTWAGEGGGVLVNQSPHNIDLFQWICGMPRRVRSFCSWGKYHTMETEDDCTAYFEYPNGASGIFIASTGEAPGTQFMEIVGDRGKIVLKTNGQQETLTFWRTTMPVSEHIRVAKSGFDLPETWKCEIPCPGAPGESEHACITQDWVNAIQKSTPLMVQGQEGINGVQLANAIHLSSWLDDWVDVPVDEKLFYEKLQQRIEGSTFKKQVRSGSMDFSASFK
ncbi:MAG: Gfo/Idh/MocA family oxidoreductase [Phycisphaerales bacterium]|nr:Gfo/Idh/MocA family oxidoreductase [Phycisphaerales bacterium]